MTGVQIRVQGADRLASTLDAAGRQFADLTEANQAAGAIVAAEAASRAPRKTGALAASFTVTSGPRRAEITAGVRYAGFQEYGTRYVTPKYYLSGALGSSDWVLDPYYQAADQALAGVTGI